VFLSFLKRERERTVNVILQTFQTVCLVKYDRSWPFNVPDRSPFLTVTMTVPDRSWPFRKRSGTVGNYVFGIPMKELVIFWDKAIFFIFMKNRLNFVYFCTEWPVMSSHWQFCHVRGIPRKKRSGFTLTRTTLYKIEIIAFKCIIILLFHSGS